MNDNKASQTRTDLIYAANQVLLQAGANQLTLEAVAQFAGVSKGGLLYHFPNKEALIQGMIDYYLELFEARIETYLRTLGDAPKPGNWLRAYVLASLDAPPDEIAVSSALLAAIAYKPELLEPMQARYKVWQARIEAEAGDNLALATIIRLAVDGLWIDDLFGMASPDPKLRADIQTVLLKLLEDMGE